MILSDKMSTWGDDPTRHLFYFIIMLDKEQMTIKAYSHLRMHSQMALQVCRWSLWITFYPCDTISFIYLFLFFRLSIVSNLGYIYSE